MPDKAAKASLFIHALTGLHPGSGTALGVVDLPVQRERHTGWPVIPASSLKGVLRDALRRKVDNEAWIALFGPETERASDHAGALSFTDARILAFPVRSLRGVFAWVTCPAVLERFKRDLALAGVAGWAGPLPTVAASETMLCAATSPVLIGDKEPKQALLEEFEFSRVGDAEPVRTWIAGNAGIDDDAKKRITSHLAILHDDDFGHFVQYATEVTARIGLDYEKRTVKKGALFYQEFLPPETLLYAVVMADDSRSKDWPSPAEQVLKKFRDNCPSRLQIGADETIGKGLCLTRFYPNGREVGR